MSFYQMGPETMAVPMGMFKENRTKVCDAMQSSTTLDSVILLEGGDNISWYDTDVDYQFKQVSVLNTLLCITAGLTFIQ